MHPGYKLKKVAIFRLTPCLYFSFQLSLTKKLTNFCEDISFFGGVFT